MSIISLELNRPGEPGQGPSSSVHLIEQVQTLIRGVALHAIESQPEEFAQLQRRMGEIADSLNRESSADDLLLAISKTLFLTEDYNRQAAVIFKAQVEELRGMVSKMTETMQFILSSSETSVKQLAFMESQLQRANTLEDLRQLKTYTSACLSMVRRESTRLQTEAREKADALKNDVERLSARLKLAAVEESQDPVTGLPGRAAAEQAIEEKVSAAKPFVTALFLMDRLASINGRFGHSVGDEIVVSCAHMLAKKLSGATLYRWSGPGFIALFDPSVGLADAEKQARQASSQELEKSIDSDNRMVMIVVGISCHVQQIPSKATAGELFRRMDGIMVAGQS
jgi:diguanylate cyclase (GGDEF)-like protein